MVTATAPSQPTASQLVGLAQAMLLIEKVPGTDWVTPTVSGVPMVIGVTLLENVPEPNTSQVVALGQVTPTATPSPEGTWVAPTVSVVPIVMGTTTPWPVSYTHLTLP